MTSGLFPVLVATFLLIESFDGWESVTYMAEETKNPEKNIPRALMWGTLAVWIASMGVHVISFGVVPWENLLGSAAPLSLLFSKIFSASLDLPLRIGIFLALVGSAAGGVISMPRLLLALARDKLFLTQFAAVHPRFKTPYKAIIFQTLASLAIIGITIGNYEKLLSLFVPLALMLYTVTILTVPTLRKKLPMVHRPFKVPFANIGPYVVSLIFLILGGVWISIEARAFALLLLGFSILLLGLPLYFLIELYYDPEMITEIRDLTARIGLISEKIFFPGQVQQEMFQWLGDLEGKSVLEFGCGTGTLTLSISEKVGPRGTVFATDLSINNLKIAKKRLERQVWQSHKLIHGKVYVIHDSQHTVRVHPQITRADAIISFGMLSYLQDVDSILADMYKLIPDGGKICFVDYVDFFKVLPNPEWLSSNAEIERIFRKAGFSVRVQRKRGMFGLWKYVFLYGIKLQYDVPVI